MSISLTCRQHRRDSRHEPTILSAFDWAWLDLFLPSALGAILRAGLARRLLPPSHASLKKRSLPSLWNWITLIVQASSITLCLAMASFLDAGSHSPPRSFDAGGDHRLGSQDFFSSIGIDVSGPALLFSSSLLSFFTGLAGKKDSVRLDSR
jgi:hypothetical protein